MFRHDFFFPVLVCIVGAVLTGPFRLDWQQRLAAVVCVTSLAWLVSHSVQRHRGSDQQNSEPPKASSAPPSNMSVNASSNGAGSPVITGNGNTVMYTTPNSMPKRPAKRSTK